MRTRKLLCAADMHICDQAGCEDALEYFRRGIRAHAPDVVVCLGDLFDSAAALAEHGACFLREAQKLHARWLFVYGNHDGSATNKGQNELGWDRFAAIFGMPQAVHAFDGRRLVTVGDCFEEADSLGFLRRNIRAGDIVLRHRPAGQALLDELAANGARLVLCGHDHALRHTRSADGRCEQRSLAPFSFGGRSGDPAGFGVVEIADPEITFQWVPQPLPLMPGNVRLSGESLPDHLAYPARARGPDAPHAWSESRPLQRGSETWTGGMGRLQYHNGQGLQWEQSYGASNQDVCSPVLATGNGREYLIIGGTWVRSPDGGGFASVAVVDPRSGREYYRVPIVGVTAPPAVADGIVFLVGQWREIVAVELATGREVWRQRSQTPPDDADGRSWFDGRTGGGWSTCQAAIGRHVWTVNARGDLFGYDRQTGAPRFVHPAAIPLHPSPCCPYANRLACVARQFVRNVSPAGRLSFEVNGQGVDDETGQLLGQPIACRENSL